MIAKADLVFGHDGSIPLAFEVMHEMGRTRPWDNKRLVLFIDHSAPSPTPEISQIHNIMRQFAKENGVLLYDVGNGVCHQVLVDEGFVRPGMFIVGADSHTVTHGSFGAFAVGVGSTDAAITISTGKMWVKVPESVRIELVGKLSHGVTSKDVVLRILGDVKADGMNYKAAEFCGEGLETLSMSSRMTISNMSAEMGAKAAMMLVSQSTCERINAEFGSTVSPFIPDEDAEYQDQFEFDMSILEPLISIPPYVDSIKTVEELQGTPIDQSFIGSCTNGRLEDLHIASKILNGKRTKARCIVIPASKKVFLMALEDGTIGTLKKIG